MKYVLMFTSTPELDAAVPPERAQDILKILADCRDGDTRRITKDGKEEEVVRSRIFPTTHFGFRKITVERPLRLNFQATPDRIARLDDEKGFQNLAESKKKGAAGEKERAEGREMQDSIRALLRGLPDTLFKNREEFERALRETARKAGLKLPAPVEKAILSALSDRDESAAICRDKDGNPSPIPSCATPRACRSPMATIPLMRMGFRQAFELSSTARSARTCRRLDRHREARLARRPRRRHRLRDQLQPLLLPLHPAPPPRGDRG